MLSPVIGESIKKIMTKSLFSTTMNAFEQHIEGQLSEIKILQDENSIAKRHLSNLEIAFNDLHQYVKLNCVGQIKINNSFSENMREVSVQSKVTTPMKLACKQL